IHHVFFWLKKPASVSDRDSLISGLRRLKDIPQIGQLHVGVPAGTEQRDVVDHSYQVSELMFFDSLSDQRSYQDHPLHQQFVSECSGLWEKVVVYDMSVV